MKKRYVSELHIVTKFDFYICFDGFFQLLSNCYLFYMRLYLQGSCTLKSGHTCTCGVTPEQRSIPEWINTLTSMYGSPWGAFNGF
ncbi:hypothetical protein ES705_14976 [subsurface metagenome]